MARGRNQSSAAHVWRAVAGSPPFILFIIEGTLYRARWRTESRRGGPRTFKAPPAGRPHGGERPRTLVLRASLRAPCAAARGSRSLSSRAVLALLARFLSHRWRRAALFIFFSRERAVQDKRANPKVAVEAPEPFELPRSGGRPHGGDRAARRSCLGLSSRAPCAPWLVARALFLVGLALGAPPLWQGSAANGCSLLAPGGT